MDIVEKDTNELYRKLGSEQLAEENLILASTELGAKWGDELKRTDRIEDLEYDLADIKFLSAERNKDITQILAELAFTFLEKLEWK